ncbi:hypothetical protein A3B51_00870 [Candidatus Curtissbacteria bacterium RIFCSPLOWO2_01_FULL_41_18]|uniref:Transposase IS200-like domain-containing protein n=1 Tax=Candidatus Curtissbacteria bacterium RIFCSPLOWO2_01_FULL_41_18 TaxID=1797727 RepID=A0A1F5HHV1_9BACT|nr:MAG: hypothetical protein A3B51_00870 [Candidatus Curtissbacteria bacterium RIFCSPLOWO2_01_FULL_41_18]
MPRGPRFIFNNAFYHVFNRGINKQPIFFTHRDYQYFLRKLGDLKNLYDHSLYAFCLMPNHFHLSIQTRKVPISKIMASIGTSYSMYFNRTYNHLGPVFQNRFRSILIENDSYFLKLSQYIYLNPVKAGLISDPLVYPYSSIREALGKDSLNFLDQNIIRLVGQTEGSRREYEKFILDGITKDLSDMEKLFEKEEAVLGTVRFATAAQKKHIRSQLKKKKNV